jgi:hypothetical protein
MIESTPPIYLPKFREIDLVTTWPGLRKKSRLGYTGARFLFQFVLRRKTIYYFFIVRKESIRAFNARFGTSLSEISCLVIGLVSCFPPFLAALIQASIACLS